MPRINKREFELNNEEYHLTWSDKPRLTKNGIKQKILPVLKEYITKNKLPIDFNNSKGNEKNTHSIATEFLLHFPDKSSKEKTKNVSTNLKEKKADKSKVSSETKQSTSIKNLKKEKMSNNITVKEKMEKLFSTLDKSIIKDKSKPKLLIIGCSDTKQPGENNEITNLFNNGHYGNLIANRNIRFNQYAVLLFNNPNYFNQIPRGDVLYFRTQMDTPLYLPALERYAGGIFYTKKLLQLYRQKNDDSKLHILIISGLYGVIEFRDSIIDYHLQIERKPFWTNNNNTSVHDAVCKYMEAKEIDNDMVFYSLSQSGEYCYKKALKPSKNWKDLWINGDRTANLRNSARFLKEYFLPNL